MTKLIPNHQQPPLASPTPMAPNPSARSLLDHGPVEMVPQICVFYCVFSSIDCATRSSRLCALLYVCKLKHAVCCVCCVFCCMCAVTCKLKHAVCCMGCVLCFVRSQVFTETTSLWCATLCCVSLFTHSQSHTHIHSHSLVLVVMMRSKEFKTKIYSHVHSLILSMVCAAVWSDPVHGQGTNTAFDTSFFASRGFQQSSQVLHQSSRRLQQWGSA